MICADGFWKNCRPVLSFKMSEICKGCGGFGGGHGKDCPDAEDLAKLATFVRREFQALDAENGGLKVGDKINFFGGEWILTKIGEKGFSAQRIESLSGK